MVVVVVMLVDVVVVVLVDVVLVVLVQKLWLCDVFRLLLSCCVTSTTSR